MRRIIQNLKVPLIVGIVIILCLLQMVWVKFSCQKGDQCGDPLPQVPVMTSQAELLPVPLQVRGTTMASKRASLKARVEGVVEALPCGRGQQVPAKTLLLSLASEDQLAQLQEAQSTLAHRQLEHKAADQLYRKSVRTETELSEARMHLEAARFAYEKARWAVAHLKLLAPFDGVVNDYRVDIGQTVEVGQELVDFICLNPLWIVAAVSERDQHKVSPGMRAKVSLSTGQQVMGEVIYRAYAANPKTRTFPIRLAVENGDLSLPEGVTADITLQGQPQWMHRFSPALLGLSDDGVVGVKGVDENKRVCFYPVGVVHQNQQEVWVIGLPKSCILITEGHEFVQPGQVVEPLPRTEKTSPPAAADLPSKTLSAPAEKTVAPA